MTLGFKTQINGKPTFFPEKIIAGLILDDRQKLQMLYEYYKDDLSNCPDSIVNPKLHTIREDPHGRWKDGKLIHPAINVRTSKYYQFAPVMKCVSVQEIEIKYTSWYQEIPIVTVEGKYLHSDTLNKLAINDGFDSIEDFFAWFNKDFTGKIIHWTPLKY